jgi:hypothetical protein
MAANLDDLEQQQQQLLIVITVVHHYVHVNHDHDYGCSVLINGGTG